MASMAESVARVAVNKGWLEAVFRGEGYKVTDIPNNPLAFRAEKEGHPIRLVKYVPGPGLITFRACYGMNGGGFGVKKEIAHEVEAANRESWVDTFYTDDDGDLWVSSYIFVTDHISGADVIRFLDMEQAGSMAEIMKTGLAKHAK